ncbi:hypothetical protein PLA107_014100 [Pseudomonas amygdali pv. lachrymans str. M301315]|uniref:Uncharacterized protein n=1 Tax=Pseudomonas amygdali pv. lachrymans str. M301315 TaxID=629260 RepID=A0AAD0LYI8_PSEAV|nr:hypothetical protein PLA107_014100 [Pseudomonas amygdali pv. lachrymans str. M301315]PWD04072.1 hypothetical protein CX658_03720 [Pseudomonas amygdali pv. lachrymans]
MKPCKKLGQILSTVIPEGSARVLRRQNNGNSRKLRLERFADWLDARPSPIPREEVDDVIFELDRLFMDQDDEEEED